ncbi:MAG: response regulator [Spirochaetales bacterium]|nr:response regulator [Spirochaetales bacterium]
MLNVLLIDDEIAALERISSMNIWDEGIYSIIGTASNGVDALAFFSGHDVDIIITDIEMPRMDGLELIRSLREGGSSIPIIILSCHESFDFARQAMSLGVDDYLIKDFLEENALRTALSRIVPIPVNTIRNPPVGEYNSDSHAEHEINILLKTIVNERDINQNKIIEKLSRLVAPSPFSLYLIHVDSYREQNMTSSQTCEYLSKIIRKCSEIFFPVNKPEIIIALDSGDYLIFHQSGPNLREMNIPEYLHNIIQTSLQNRKISLTIVWNQLLNDVSEIADEIDNVRALARFRPFIGKGRVILKEHVNVIAYIDSRALEENIRKLHGYGREGSVRSILSLIGTLYRQYLPGMIQYNYIQYLNSHVLTVLLQLIDKESFDLQDLYTKRYLPIQELNTLETTEEIFKWFEGKFKRIQTVLEENEIPLVSNARVQKALELISKEYRNSTMSLDLIADRIGIHKVYLSRVFKDEVGTSCYEFLQQFRIRKAQSMLKAGQMKIYEIAELTGFHNYDQFCIAFKKHTNVSPSVFRKEYR